jgi:hypothetical protein
MEDFDATNIHRGKVLRLTDLLDAPMQLGIKEMVFEDCQINGPTVIWPIGSCQMNNCHFDAEPDAFLWEVDPVARPNIAGAVIVENCLFERCRFTAVGIAGTPESIAEIRKNFSP